MAVGKLSSRTSLTDPVTRPVAVVRGCLVEVVDRVSDRLHGTQIRHSGSGGRVHKDSLRGPTDHGDLG